jgi:hypothetical protein
MADTASVEPGVDIEKRRARYARYASEMEEQRQKTLPLLRASLAALHENADVFSALHRHITRLGWRTEREEDQERARQKHFATAQAAVQEIVQEIKKLESRPESPAGDWTKSLRRGEGIELIAGDGRSSEEQWEVIAGRAQKRLVDLATSGRI